MYTKYAQTKTQECLSPGLKGLPAYALIHDKHRAMQPNYFI